MPPVRGPLSSLTWQRSGRQGAAAHARPRAVRRPACGWGRRCAAANTTHADGTVAPTAENGGATTRSLLAATKSRSGRGEEDDEMDNQIAKQLREFLENGG